MHSCDRDVRFPSAHHENVPRSGNPRLPRRRKKAATKTCMQKMKMERHLQIEKKRRRPAGIDHDVLKSSLPHQECKDVPQNPFRA